MLKKNLKYIILFLIASLLVFIVVQGSFISLLKYEFSAKSSFKIKLDLINPEVKALAVDPSNKLYLKLTVRSAVGKPVSMARVNLSVDKPLGSISPKSARTDKNGEVFVVYTPPAYTNNIFNEKDNKITISSDILNTQAKSSVELELKRNPIIFIHGYQADGSVFNNMKDYLSPYGYEGNAIDYKSEKGIVEASKELDAFIELQKHNYYSKGEQVGKFDIVSHSMGGLIARYYTANEYYVNKNDIRKIIFLSVPHKGSPWATIGLTYQDNQGVRDLAPDSNLLINIFPYLINKGLNKNIQIGNIAVKYDEVVSPESAGIDEWDIKADIFNIGDSSFTMENILNGNIVDANNHKSVLSNTKVFEKVKEMLDSELNYPSVRK